SHIRKRLSVTGSIDLGNRGRVSSWNDLTIGEREICDGQIAVLVPHGRAQPELTINKAGDNQGKGCQRAKWNDRSPHPLPNGRNGERDNDKQTQKSLCQAGVKNSDLILEQGYAQAAKNPLEDDCA